MHCKMGLHFGWVFNFLYTYLYVICGWVYIYYVLCVCVYVCIVCVHIYVYVLYVCMYVCMCIYIHVTSHVGFYPMSDNSDMVYTMSGKINYAINHVGNCITIYHVRHLIIIS